MKSKHLTRALGLALLAIGGVMAVGATAAQAKWLLLRNGASVQELNLEASVSLAKILLPELGAEIDCKSGAGPFTVGLSEEGKSLSTAITAALANCTDVIFAESCTVASEGQADGKIVISSAGEGAMTGEEYFVDMFSSGFSFVEYHGEECPLLGVQDTLSGNLQLGLSEPLANSNAKTAHVTSQELSYWGGIAILHNGTGSPLSISLKESSGATWALHLVGL